jgi:hypothetical protein
LALFVLDTSGSAIGGAYVGGAWPLLFKRIFLIAGIIATLGSSAHVERCYSKRQGEYYPPVRTTRTSPRWSSGSLGSRCL